MPVVRRDLVTGILSAVAVVVVFAVAGGLVPTAHVPAAPRAVIRAIPHVNAVISLAAIVAIATGWRAIRAGNVDRHRRAMLAAIALFVLFLSFYLYRLAVLGGPTDFEGPRVVYRFVFLPVLAVHVLLAVICIPLVVDTAALGLAIPVDRLGRTRHPRVGRIAASLWLVSFSLGLVVYALLYWLP